MNPSFLGCKQLSREYSASVVRILPGILSKYLVSKHLCPLNGDLWIITGVRVHQRLSPWQSLRVVYCSTVVPSDEVTVVYQNGLPVISVNLPSRRERCQFTLKPISDSVGVFLQQLQAEDRGIDRVAIYSADGTRVASSTGIDLLLLDDFKLIINDVTYLVRPPKRELLSHEDATTLNDVKTLVQQLYTALCIEEHQLNKEKELIGRLEELKEQLAPLEKEYAYPDARDRQYLLFFHKGAKKTRFDLEKYNQLKDAIAQAELDLKRLRDPLQVHLPIQQIDEKD
ncbi:calcium uniporter protein, mitochondrial isoform X7 [Struthio camelus]|uniref:calcium uniporter protein, mitochondrial isoform X7 n=1 Tax=Struthio camelus TaxID=8801 RepID=UPI003604288A